MLCGGLYLPDAVGRAFGHSLLLPRRAGPRLRAGRLTQPDIADYALLGDCRSAALVSRAGSIDWLCWPRFDSPACLAALLGTGEHGSWRIAPVAPALHLSRAYRPGTLILETSIETAEGSVAVIDFLAAGTDAPTLVRIVEGRSGQVSLHMHLRLGFDYGATIPWVTGLPDHAGLLALAGPDRVVLRSGLRPHVDGPVATANFRVGPGERVAFVLSHGPSHLKLPDGVDPVAELARTQAFWTHWHPQAAEDDQREQAVSQSLRVLKAMTYAPTGGIVAAPTTSLPELPGGQRNWDYRFCWLRDSALTIRALLRAGHTQEASAWRDWLLRAVAGSAAQVHTIYGLAGERRLAEWEADWLPGYQGAHPVRIGNGAAGQLQIDVFGELMDTLHLAARAGLPPDGDIWQLQVALLAQLETVWAEPDEGIWEVRGGRQHFTYSKVMAWVAFDRAIASAEAFGLPGPLPRWRAIRGQIHETVLRDGFNARRGSFVQSFGGQALDASLLQLPLVGFLPVDDPRIAGTVAAIERELTEDGLVLRYHTEETGDGLPPGEGVFLACSFWLVEVMALQGRRDQAGALFERLLAIRNDVGLLAEEYDPRTGKLLGNFPQAFSHLALTDAAWRLRPRADIIGAE